MRIRTALRRSGWILALLFVCSAPQPAESTQSVLSRLVPFQEDVFTGHFIKPTDEYRICRVDSKGNIYLLTHHDVVSRISPNGTIDFELDSRSEISPPIQFNDVTVGPDDALYLVGVSMIKTSGGSKIYRISPGEHKAVFVHPIPGIDPIKCLVNYDLTLHLLSYETAWINALHRKQVEPATFGTRFNATANTISDNAIRRYGLPKLGSATSAQLSPTIWDQIQLQRGEAAKTYLSAFHSIEMPIEHARMQEVRQKVVDTMVVRDRRGNIQLVDPITGDYRIYTGEGQLINTGSLPALDKSVDDSFMVDSIVWLNNDYFIYKVVYLDSKSYLKSVVTKVCHENTGYCRVLPFERTGPGRHYNLESHMLSDTLVQYWFHGKKLHVNRFHIPDILASELSGEKRVGKEGRP